MSITVTIAKTGRAWLPQVATSEQSKRFALVWGGAKFNRNKPVQ